MRRSIIALIAAIIIILSISGCGTRSNAEFDQSCLTVYFFDVGQADSSLLLFPDGTVMLIDSGNKADGDRISGYLKELGIEHIDYFVYTHPHEDHIGGAESIFDNFKVETVCMPDIDKGFVPDTAIYKNLCTAVKKENCRELMLSAGTYIAENETYSILAVAPRYGSVYSNLNDWSLCLRVDCFTNTLLFTGDAELPSELDMMSLGVNLDADILKVGHHGSANSSTANFLSAVTPLVSVISVGTDNSYGHPTSAALQRLGSTGSKVFRTDTVGTVIAKCYDGGFNIETDNSINLNGN